MITKDEFLASCAHEIRVIKHLATKVPKGGLSWRPTPAQRSTEELLRYLTTSSIVPARAMVTGEWEDGEEVEKAEAAVDLAQFAAAMDRQERDLRALLTPIPDADFATKTATLPWGTPASLGLALVDTVLKTLVAYRMQLFLYAKAAGNADLGPANCWVGVDVKKAAANG